MNKKTKSNGFGGWGLYVIFILAFVLIAYTLNQTNQPATITKAEFELGWNLGEIAELNVVLG